jgi:hypothetical protein
MRQQGPVELERPALAPKVQIVGVALQVLENRVDAEEASHPVTPEGSTDQALDPKRVRHPDDVGASYGFDERAPKLRICFEDSWSPEVEA